MTVIVRVAPICAVLLGTSACETVRDLEAQSRVDPQTIALYRLSARPSNACPVAPIGRYANTKGKKVDASDRGPGDNHTGAVPLDCFNFPNDPEAKAYTTAAAAEGEAYKAAVGTAKTGEEARYARNRLASILMKQSDDVCTVEMGRLISRDAMVNTTLSIFDSLFSTASTVTSGKLAKSILSGSSTVMNNSRESINAHVYRNVMSTAVAKAIDKERKKNRLEILDHFDEGTVDYPVDEMIMEVNNYHQTCSFYRGLGLVLDAVSRDENTNEFTRLSGEIAILQGEIDALAARKPKAGSEEAKEIDKEITSKRQMLIKLQEARTKIILPAVAEKKSDDKGGGGGTTTTGTTGTTGATHP